MRQQQVYCMHEPHQTDLIDWDFQVDEILVRQECQCGSVVIDTYTFSGRKVYSSSHK